MSAQSQPFVGSVYWLVSPNPLRLPMLAYCNRLLDERVEMMVVSTDPSSASSDDLVYFASEHDYHDDLVVHVRLVFEVPLAMLQTKVTQFPENFVSEIRSTDSGRRRATYRTGVLIRDAEEARWDYALQQKAYMDDLLSDLERVPDVMWDAALVTVEQAKRSDAQVAEEHIAQLLLEGDTHILGISPTKLREVGLGDQVMEVFAAALRIAEAKVLDSTWGLNSQELEALARKLDSVNSAREGALQNA